MESKPDLSQYLITGPFTNDQTNPDISWKALSTYKDPKFRNMENGIPIQNFWDNVKKRDL